METKVNYTIVGFFVVALTVAMILIFFWLSALTHHQAYKDYLVYARGGVDGLTVQSPVLFNGVRVGLVEEITIDAKNPQLVRLLLKLEKQTPVTESTTATLVPQGITGLVYVGLSVTTAKALPLKAKEGENYAVIPYEKPVLVKLTEVLPELADNLQDIAKRVQKLFDEQNIHHFSEILFSIDKIFSSIEPKIDVLMGNGIQATRSLNSALLATQQTMQRFDKAGQILLPSVQELLTHLDELTTHLTEVSEDLERNPSILIRGKQPPPKGPGE